MSGYFMIDRRFLDEVKYGVSGIGFKILVDLVSSLQRTARIGEVPYRFRNRAHGESKLDILVLVEYLQLLADKVVGDWISSRFLLFGLVGFLGALVNLAVLALLHWPLQLTFSASVVASTFVAMTFNFFLNNSITYRDRRLKGWGLVPGLLSFYVACSIGVLINYVASNSLYTGGGHWLWAGGAGVAISSVWNFVVTRAFTWRLGRRSVRRQREQRLGATAAA